MELTPAIKGNIGDWEYYLTVMKFGEVANRIQFSHELHPHSALDDQIQRELTNRVKEMTNYLVNQTQHFYGALIVAVYGGAPRFEKVRMEEHSLLDFSDTPFGLVRFDGNQRYFALDGQHRLCSIKEAIKQKPELAEDEVSIILVPHYESPEGLERTRRLFATVNRYAKPTSQHVNIIMDEDDKVAISTRRLIRDYGLFHEDLIKVKGSSIGPNDPQAITTLRMLYLCTEDILRAEGFSVDKGSKQQRPSEDSLENMYSALSTFWDGLRSHFIEFEKVANYGNSAGEFRFPEPSEEPKNGHLLFRPIGQQLITGIYLQGRKEGLPADEVFERLSKVDWTLSSAPWKGVFWRGEKMITSKESLRLGINLGSYMIGIPIPDEEDLLETYRTETEDPEAQLPPKV